MGPSWGRGFWWQGWVGQGQAGTACPVLSPICELSQEHSPSSPSTWLLGGNSPLQPCACSLLMLLDILGLV